MVMEFAMTVGILLIGGVFTVLWWLLRQKDAAQQNQITELFALHRKNEGEINNLKVQLAAEHYRKVELDVKFDKIDSTLKDGFEKLGDKYDRTYEMLVQYFRPVHQNPHHPGDHHG